MPVSGVNEARRESDEDEDGHDFQQHHHINERGPIEAEVPARGVERIPFQVDEAPGKVSGGDPTRVGMKAKPIKEVDNMLGKTNADGHVADRIFQDKVPADNPGY